jgi:hypothetical protein
MLLLLLLLQCNVKPLPAPAAAPIGNFSPEAAAAAWTQKQQSLNLPVVVSCVCPTLDPPDPSLQHDSPLVLATLAASSNAIRRSRNESSRGRPGLPVKSSSTTALSSPLAGMQSYTDDEDSDVNHSVTAAAAADAAAVSIAAAAAAGTSDAAAIGSDDGACSILSWDEPQQQTPLAEM